MTQMDQILGLERQFWKAGPDFFREHAAEPCLLVFPAMTALLSAAEVAATIENAVRWQDVSIEDLHRLTLQDNVVVLSYVARALRPGADTYVARVSSIYTRHDAEWRLTFHQHTPL